MKPSFASSARCIAVMAALSLFGCTSDSLGGATGTGGAAGGAGGTTGAAGSGGTMATGGTAGTMATGGVAGTGGRYSFCGYPDSTHCFPNTCGNGVRDTCPNPYAGTGIDCDNPFTEQCDGEDLGTATCTNRNLGSGTLRCTSDCVLDTSGCSGAQGGSGGASAATARP